jgi:hypothetical protein
LCPLQAGAKHVYGIECSAIADQATQIVKDNGYEDRVTILKGKVRQTALGLAPVPEADPASWATVSFNFISSCN